MILLDGVRVKFGKFPNGESNLNFNNLEFHGHSEVTLKYESDQDLFDLFILKKYMDTTPMDGQWRLNILYMPYSRMDRRNLNYTFNLKFVCELINSMNFKEVEVLDAHSDVTLALLNNCYGYTLIPQLFSKFLESDGLPTIVWGNGVTGPDTKDLVIMFPDAGAEKRYSNQFRYPSVVGTKERDFKTGNITKFDFYGVDVFGKYVVIVDDLCSKGGTFVGAARALRERGARKVFLIVTHCENTILQGEVGEYIDHVFTTNSIIEVAPSYVSLMKAYNEVKREL